MRTFQRQLCRPAAALGRLVVLAAFSISSIASAQFPLPGGENSPPLANAGPDISAEAIGETGFVVLNAAASIDFDGDPLTYTWSVTADSAATIINPPSPSIPIAQGHFPVGVHTVTLTVDDGRGGVSTDQVRVEITPEPNTAPEVLVTLSKTSLPPCNRRRHKVKITALPLSDAVSSLSELVVVCRVSSNEPDRHIPGRKGLPGDVNRKDGYTQAVVVDMNYSSKQAAFVGWVWLRAEADSAGSGRTYTVSCEVADPFGGIAEDSATVTVASKPRSNSRSSNRNLGHSSKGAKQAPSKRSFLDRIRGWFR